MANLGYVESALGGLGDDTKRPITKAFEYVLGFLSLGAVEHQTRATNLQAVWLTATTSTTANQEFSIEHRLERTPTYAIPIAALGSVNTRLVPLTVSRAADETRVYFTSSSANVPIAVLVG